MIKSLRSQILIKGLCLTENSSVLDTVPWDSSQEREQDITEEELDPSLRMTEPSLFT